MSDKTGLHWKHTSPENRAYQTIVIALTTLMFAVGCSTGSSAPAGKDSVTVVEADPVSGITSFVCCQPYNFVVVREIQQAPDVYLYDPATKAYSLQPLLATSWKQTNPTTWEFQVRPGVKFSNGEPVTADTFVQTLAIYRDNNTNTANNFGKIRITAVGDTTFDVITTKENDATLPSIMTYLWLIPPKYFASVGAQGWATHPIGTGPYMLDKWVRGVEVDLKTNPNYWGSKPSINHVAIRSVSNAGTQVAQLTTGQADLVTLLPGEYADTVKNSSNARLEEGPAADMVFYFMDASGAGAKAAGVANDPVTNVLVRQAINYAIDRDAIIKDVLKGHAFPLHCLYFPGQLGYTNSCTGYPHDPAKAKDLLAQAGYPNGLTIQQNCTIGDVPADQDVGAAVQGQLAQVGIKTNLNCLPADTQSANYANGKSVGMLFWDLGPLIIFDTSRYCNVYLLPGGAYYGYVNTPQLEGLCTQAATASTTDARKALYQQIQDIAVNQEALWAPLYEASNVYGVNKALKWSVQPTSGQDLYLENASWSS